MTNTQFQPISRRISETVQDNDRGYYDGLIGTRICALDWYQNHRPWMTLNCCRAYTCACSTDKMSSPICSCLPTLNIACLLVVCLSCHVTDKPEVPPYCLRASKSRMRGSMSAVAGKWQFLFQLFRPIDRTQPIADSHIKLVPGFCIAPHACASVRTWLPVLRARMRLSASGLSEAVDSWCIHAWPTYNQSSVSPLSRYTSPGVTLFPLFYFYNYISPIDSSFDRYKSSPAGGEMKRKAPSQPANRNTESWGTCLHRYISHSIELLSAAATTACQK